MMAVAQESSTCCTLETVRQFLTSQEDTIVYRLIDRAKFPLNSPIYNQTFELQPGSSVTLIQFVVRETEIAQAKAGRYLDPQENPFFPDNLPSPITPLHKKYPEFLHPPAASVNVNQMIWDFYFDQFLPTLVTPGDDGHYAATSASDTECLQALSKRIHYGKYVAEVKYREAPHEYEPLIRSKDSEGLMNLLTFKKQEEMVMKRVEKKGMVLGQYVSLNDTAENSGKYKIDPSLVSQLYEKWVMPLTKRVQVDYLLKRLD
ncbi:Chorismate mutase 2 [Linum grandiflorum]